jgi:hypothetical protein
VSPTLVPPADPLGIPAQAELLQALLVATFAAHYAFLGAALGGSVLVALGGLLGRRDGLGRARLVARTVSPALPVVISFAINTGVAPLLFVQVLYGSFFYTANVLLGFRWLALLVFLIVGFYGAYVLAARHRTLAPDSPLRHVVGAAVAIAFLAVALTLVVNHLLSVHPGAWAAVRFEGAATLGLPTLWPRYLHAVLGAGVVGSMLLAHLAARRASRGDPRGNDLARVGLLLAGLLGIVQGAAGAHYLFALPATVRESLLAPHETAPWLWAGGAIAAVASVAVCLLGSRLREPRAAIWLATALIGATTVGMSAGREHVRLYQIAARIPQGAWDHRPQLGPMVLFVCTAIAGAIAIVWMLRALRRAAPALGEEE